MFRFYFSQTYKSMNDKRKEISTKQRFQLIYEYGSDWRVPPPLCAIEYPCIVIAFWISLCKTRTQDKDHFPSPAKVFGETSKIISFTLNKIKMFWQNDWILRNKTKIMYAKFQWCEGLLETTSSKKDIVQNSRISLYVFMIISN